MRINLIIIPTFVSELSSYKYFICTQTSSIDDPNSLYSVMLMTLWDIP